MPKKGQNNKNELPKWMGMWECQYAHFIHQYSTLNGLEKYKTVVWWESGAQKCGTD